MAKGTLTIKFEKNTIDKVLVDLKEPSDGILKLNEWIIPHWDLASNIKIGAVKVNQKTVEYIIGRMKSLFPDRGQAIVYLWLNYGFSVDSELADWKCKIDLSKIEYKEYEE
jgi:hypothetical protein